MDAEPSAINSGETQVSGRLLPRVDSNTMIRTTALHVSKKLRMQNVVSETSA
jgi:hypothetical protein